MRCAVMTLLPGMPAPENAERMGVGGKDNRGGRGRGKERGWTQGEKAEKEDDNDTTRDARHRRQVGSFRRVGPGGRDIKL